MFIYVDKNSPFVPYIEIKMIEILSIGMHVLILCGYALIFILPSSSAVWCSNYSQFRTVPWYCTPGSLAQYVQVQSEHKGHSPFKILEAVSGSLTITVPDYVVWFAYFINT